MTDRELAYLNGLRDGYFRALQKHGPQARTEEQRKLDEAHWRECARKEFPDFQAKAEAA